MVGPDNQPIFFLALDNVAALALLAPSLRPSNPRTKHEGKTRRALREAEAGNEMASGVIYALTNLGQGGDFRDLFCPIVTLAVEPELFHEPGPER